jgi:bifunctional UDP-N-acetylglucosamine pyrophosphorylase/glucosamine-1-phosphate N-acetyltransferase
MRSATPKMLHPLCGRPMVAWTLAAALEGGAGKIVVVDGPARQLEPSVNGRATIAVQAEPRGTADAVSAASSHLGRQGTVIVLNGDAPLVRPETIAALAEAHGRSGSAATIATAVLDDPSGYGRVIRAPDGTVDHVVETKVPGDASDLELRVREVNTGLYAFDADELLDALARVGSDNAQGEFYLPDVLPLIRSHERTVDAYEVPDPLETLGVNDRAELARVRAIAQGRIHERHMLAGVTIVDPSSTVIDADVEIEADTVIAPFTSLHGATRIGARVTIGPLSTLIDTRVGEGASVIHSYATDAEIGEHVSVGPFAYLRPGTVLRAGSKAGTFVEIKNSTVGAGAKVPHLSYIGDAEIGDETNIGAGTITANYDGYRKHRTSIGARAKVSVDTMFVAPVSMGDEAYTAAGSVITKDIPPGALGVARERQQNVEGYAHRRAQREAASEGDVGIEPDAPSEREGAAEGGAGREADGGNGGG